MGTETMFSAIILIHGNLEIFFSVPSPGAFFAGLLTIADQVRSGADFQIVKGASFVRKGVARSVQSRASRTAMQFMGHISQLA